uniref:Uncharacterized protein n=1 Tax=Hemiselmis tepida TaxID=464990 RepID=A0A7S0W2M7_9CRYP|mmetsp:Transcript_37815/g.96665  ORF Transcript_37815/g.96665 Transcript_37815/m.96665 type:complete len:202 (+) Transcript_37815:25-630(+)|eukprot:CAMPEP_0174927024 /NCGR_PEP_ID=MMETSP1355-20121228/17308_1 /TAXON_ID=464990 /ORGANISM="Hemiselmis tepida, Strain CCMP443" /LENGTH=201 /DNA_ID=CAMNT_0016173101 /DNA_START=24 /DNA_END=629 /DNA_ORIENTATION=-
MLRTSILAAIAATAVAFTGPAPMLRTGASGVTMQMDRRAAVGAVGASILAAPALANAKGGDFPKQSYFGAAPLSAPFGDTYGTQGEAIWSQLGDTEREIFQRIATKTAEQLSEDRVLIERGEWEASRQKLRLLMGETRKSMVRLSKLEGTDASTKAQKKFYKAIERLDLSLKAKSADDSIAGISDCLTTYGAWLATVGLEI